MKKLRLILSAVICILLLVCTFPVSVSAKTTADGFEYTIENNEVEITKYTGTTPSLAIPSKIDGKPVTSIGYEAFDDCNFLEKVSIPNSVSSIGMWSFSRCENLKEITIPKSVTYINSYAFSRCSSLEEVFIPENVKTIESGVFSNCSALKKITVDENNPIYDSRENSNTIIETESNTLIQGCSTTKIPASVTIIGYSAFSGCNFQSELIIPQSVSKIESSAFNDCIFNTGLILPNGLTSIENGTFMFSQIKEITIPSTVTSIGQDAFSFCFDLTDVHYSGTAEQWNKIKISNEDESNQYLLSANIHHNSYVEVYEQGFEPAFTIPQTFQVDEPLADFEAVSPSDLINSMDYKIEVTPQYESKAEQNNNSVLPIILSSIAIVLSAIALCVAIATLKKKSSVDNPCAPVQEVTETPTHIPEQTPTQATE